MGLNPAQTPQAQRPQQTHDATQGRQREGPGQRPEIPRLDRAEAGFRLLDRFELVYQPVDVLQGRSIGRAEVTPARQVRDAGERLLVEIGRRIDAAAAADDRGDLELLGTDTDRVNP